MDPTEPPAPPVSRRSRSRFRDRERREQLAGTFTRTGAEYERLRPGYPTAALDAILESVPGARHAVDLGAGTGKLSRSLAARGLDVVAVDPAASMLEQLDGIPAAGEGAGRVRPHRAAAESTGLPAATADLVTVAQAWHWFDVDAASAEVRRLLRCGGMLALLWNSLDVTVPWVHRLSRIMHAGDVYRDDFTPPLGDGLHVVDRRVMRWEDPMISPDLVDLAHTRSYVIDAAPDVREKVLANLDWYVHEHLGHGRGEVVRLPYRTDLFLCRAVGEDGGL